MLEYLEKETCVIVEGGFYKKKPLTGSYARFYRKTRVIADSYCSNDRYEWTHNWHDVPEKTEVSRLCWHNKKSKDKPEYLTIALIDYLSEDGVYPVVTIDQRECPMAQFTVVEKLTPVKQSDFTIKELLETQPADKALQYLKERGLPICQ